MLATSDTSSIHPNNSHNQTTLFELSSNDHCLQINDVDTLLPSSFIPSPETRVYFVAVRRDGFLYCADDLPFDDLHFQSAMPVYYWTGWR
jgi:hypothetical protein